MSESTATVLHRAISPDLVRPDGTLTWPRSYGVYRLPAKNGATKRFRFGNHPVRMRELESQFGPCKLEHLFLQRTDAKRVADSYNAGSI